PRPIFKTDERDEPDRHHHERQQRSLPMGHVSRAPTLSRATHGCSAPQLQEVPGYLGIYRGRCCTECKEVRASSPSRGCDPDTTALASSARRMVVDSRRKSHTAR